MMTESEYSDTETFESELAVWHRVPDGVPDDCQSTWSTNITLFSSQIQTIGKYRSKKCESMLLNLFHCFGTNLYEM